MYYSTAPFAPAPFAPDIQTWDPLMAIARWAVGSDRDAAARANTRKDFGELLRNDDLLIEALCGVDPLI